MGVGFAPAAWALESSRSQVLHAREDDRAAFRAVFDRCAPAVYRLLCDLLRDPALADEATQETFVRAFRRLDSVREEDRLVPWLMGIARNVSFESKRRRARERGEERAPAVSHATPESDLQGRQTENALSEALGQLSPGRRAALLMRADHGLSYDEIASAMGWSLAKVKVEIHRARQQLRSLMGPHLEEAR
jgi:RNA polymerase sigma-70 factor (ECF subfamily)